MAYEPQTDQNLFAVMAGNDTTGWRDISADVVDLQYSDVRPGGAASASFTVYTDLDHGLNELQPDNEIIISYAGQTRWRGSILPRAVSYAGGSGIGKVPVRIEAVGTLAVAKRRKDYAEGWVDRDLAMWYTADRDDLCAGLNWQRSGWLKCVAPNGSTYAANSYVEIWYWAHGGLATEYIYGVTFKFTSSGALHWDLYETTDEPSATATWASLATDGGSTHASAVTINETCSANVKGLALKVYYDDAVTTALTADEWVKVTQLDVRYKSGTITVGTALEDILVTTGLGDSYSSSTVS